MARKVYAIATTEVQEDSTLCDASVAETFEDARQVAEAFMLRCVGDFFEIDPCDAKGRSRKLEERVFRETNAPAGYERLELTYECGGLVLAATVQEVCI